MERRRTPLNTGWQFKQTTSLNGGTASSYLPVAQFPTVAHIDLLHHGLIKDPYIDCNELETLWFVPSPFSPDSPIPELNVSKSG
jgi:beta-mannosidase